jgi:hypothetical protein
MMRNLAKRAGRPLWLKLKARIDAAIDARLRAYGYPIPYQHQPLQEPSGVSAQSRLFVPPCPPFWNVDAPFMAHSTCSSADLMHPEFEQVCRRVKISVHYHRKLWEWVFIVHHLERAGVLREGASGIAFGVGKETLPAYFAQRGAHILATDAPPDIGESGGWAVTGQHSSALEGLYVESLLDRPTFDARVRFRTCDMNAIPEDIGRFDFTWSSCCFEHLGTLEAGMRFVVESVEKCLKPGGIAVHTTEFNLSSNDDTVEQGETVIYRKRDLEGLVERLRSRGHEVQPFTVAPDSHYLDGFVDVPPYTHAPHLKLQLGKYVATSAGIVVRRGT